MKIFLSILLILTSLFSSDIKPEKEIEVSGSVMDMKIYNDFLYIGTDTGTLEVYDIKKDTFTDKIKLKNIHDFMGDVIPPKVYSVDVLDNKKLLLAQGENGSREVYIHENNQTVKVIDKDAKLTIQKAKFIDKNLLFLGLLSNEIVLFDIKNKKQLYIKQLSQSKFSDFALNEDKTKAVISCESGINYLVQVKDAKVIKELKGGNKDNVFKIAFKNGKISAAGQDRLGVVYDEKSGNITNSYNSTFLIYATRLDDEATRAAFSFGTDNEIAIFNLTTNVKTDNLKGQKSTLNSILFYNNNTLFSGSDDKYIMKWKLK